MVSSGQRWAGGSWPAHCAWSDGEQRNGGLVCPSLHFLHHATSRAVTPRGCPAGGSRAARLNEGGEEGSTRCCCAGEAVGLDVELHNPLQLDLALTHLRLACSWEPAAGAAGGGQVPEGSPTGAQGSAGEQAFQVRWPLTRQVLGSGQPRCLAALDTQVRTAQPMLEACWCCSNLAQLAFSLPLCFADNGTGWFGCRPPVLQLHEESVTLHGGERVVVHLRVVPLRPGTLQVHGLSWLLNGVAHGQAAFCIPQPCPRKPGSSSK